MSGTKYPHAIGHKGDLDTGRNQVLKAPSMRARALAVIERNNASSEQIANEIGEHFVVVRARASELRAMGLINDSGLRADSALGAKSVIWRVTTTKERAAFAVAREAGQ